MTTKGELIDQLYYGERRLRRTLKTAWRRDQLRVIDMREHEYLSGVRPPRRAGFRHSPAAGATQMSLEQIPVEFTYNLRA